MPQSEDGMGFSGLPTCLPGRKTTPSHVAVHEVSRKRIGEMAHEMANLASHKLRPRMGAPDSQSTVRLARTAVLDHRALHPLRSQTVPPCTYHSARRDWRPVAAPAKPHQGSSSALILACILVVVIGVTLAYVATQALHELHLRRHIRASQGNRDIRRERFWRFYDVVERHDWGDREAVLHTDDFVSEKHRL